MRLLGAQANVLHPDAVAPSQRAAVPINIRNTANPTHPGTLIVHDDDERAQRGAAQQVVGVTIQDDAVVVVCTAISHVDQVAAVLKAEAPAGEISLGKEFRVDDDRWEGEPTITIAAEGCSTHELAEVRALPTVSSCVCCCFSRAPCGCCLGGVRCPRRSLRDAAGLKSSRDLHKRGPCMHPTHQPACC